MKEARDGQQCGDGQYALRKVTASRRNASSAGVIALYGSSGSTEQARCWSVLKMRMLGWGMGRYVLVGCCSCQRLQLGNIGQTAVLH